ncbi:rhophilin-1 [Astyanax mexicanus]|uniref:Rhophilin Rho GTPase binding protein 1 n=2 Tax=Astyanax mexicanus TaxID=7994 RepID=A0A8B9I0Z4_ASTMX|nr:rhophilin-1 [Astyanax mexicanus]KAG9282521.1 rhophilin-1 [Astyanax mexicanus]
MSDTGSEEEVSVLREEGVSGGSVRKGCDPLVLTQRSKLQQRRAKLNQQINRELRLRTGAENLYRATTNQKVKETVSLELSFVNSNLQLLKEELEELNSSMEVYQTESEKVNVPMIPLGLKETKEIDMTIPLQDFISEHYGEDASLYMSEVKEFMDLRQAMRTPSRNDAGLELLMEYYNQLYFLDQRFFAPHRTLGVHFHWYDSLTGVPSCQRALAFEKGSVLFNIGALYTQIGARQDRSTLPGIQNAIDAFQRAAGAFLYLQENFSHAPSLDMSSPALSMLVRLMVAQVQECICERVTLTMEENDLMSNLQAAQESARVSDVYSLVLQAMSVPLLKDYVPFSWLSVVQVKTQHFRALAHYYTAAALCDCSDMIDKVNDCGSAVKALKLVHTRPPDTLCLQEPEDRLRLGKGHLRKAIIRHEEALRLHGVCKMLRKMDILQEVLSYAHTRSLEKYSDIDQEDDFCEIAEAPEIQSHTYQKPDIKTPDFSSVRVTDIFHRLGPLSLFCARNRWVGRRLCLVRGEAGLGLTLRGDSPVLVAGVLPEGCAAEAGLHEGDYIVAVNGSDCRWAEHAEVVHVLKGCSERGVELDVITLLTNEVEKRAASLSPSSDRETVTQQRQGGDSDRGSTSLLNWSWRSGGGGRVTKRLGSTFSLPFGSLRESESMY